MNRMISMFIVAQLFMTNHIVYCSDYRQSLVGYYEPEFTRPLTNLTVTVGREAVFSCHVSNLGQHRIGWVKTDDRSVQAIHKFVIIDDPRLAVTHEDHSVWKLHIKKVEVQDRGEYMCQVNTDPMKSQRAFLEVVVPPDILNEGSSTDLMVPEGSPANLVCRTTGYPKPVVSWRKDGGEVNYEGEVLQFPKISRNDMGLYLCIASNGVPPTVSKRMTISVHFHPVINVPNQLVGAPRATDIKLECSVESFPKPILFWTKNSGDMIVSNVKYEIIETEVSVFKSKIELIVRNFSQLDAGSYSCNAKNSVGDAETAIRLYEIPGDPSERSGEDMLQHRSHHHAHHHTLHHQHRLHHSSDKQLENSRINSIQSSDKGHHHQSGDNYTQELYPPLSSNITNNFSSNNFSSTAKLEPSLSTTSNSATLRITAGISFRKINNNFLILYAIYYALIA